ncbi:hypothetical protein ACQB60_05890 [Actinomycetota bacterium Odt1-20B]
MTLIDDLARAERGPVAPDAAPGSGRASTPGRGHRAARTEVAACP